MNQLYLDLCKVKALLVAGWGQGNGRDETHLCPVDAIWQLYREVPGPTKARATAVQNALYEELHRTVAPRQMGFVDWNDHPSRTKAEVIDLVQRAADRAASGISYDPSAQLVTNALDWGGDK
jgi:hypothetical protein